MSNFQFWVIQVGIAQQWYDYLDNLAFTTQEIDIGGDEHPTDSVVEGRQDDKLHINCTVNTSPGTSEVRFALLFVVAFQYYFSSRAHKITELYKV